MHGFHKLLGCDLNYSPQHYHYVNGNLQLPCQQQHYISIDIVDCNNATWGEQKHVEFLGDGLLLQARTAVCRLTAMRESSLATMSIFSAISDNFWPPVNLQENRLAAKPLP